MRLVTYSRDGQTGIGVLSEDGVAPIEGYNTMLELIQSGQAGLDAATRASGSTQRITEYKLEAPLRGSSKLLFSGVNFVTHILEEGGEAHVPKMWRFFSKLPSSVIGPNEPIVLPTMENQIDPEVEMALIIGKTAKGVKRTEALDYVFGYTAVNDVGARDIQFTDTQEDRGKGIDTFTPMGPEIVLTDEIQDPQNASLKLWVNDQEWQSDTTAHMHWSFAAIIESVSAHITLYPGDIVTSGTPAGIGYFRTPQEFLHHGDVVTVEVGGIGRLTNPVVGAW